MSELLKLRPYEAVAAFQLAERDAGTYKVTLWAEGQAILSTVFVQSVSPGASVKVRYVDQSLGEAFNEAMELGAHDEITEDLTSNKKLITRFHARPTVVCEVVGGPVNFGVFLSMVEATADADYGFGKTVSYVGSVGTTEKTVPPEAGQSVQGLSVRCSIDQATSKRLLFSLDGGENFIRLAPGEAFAIAPRGNVKQIHLKSVADQTNYEVIINTSS